MSRPKKERELTYTHLINLRLSDTQYDLISEAASNLFSHCQNISALNLMKGKVVAKYEIVADVPELKKLISEFGKSAAT